MAILEGKGMYLWVISRVEAGNPNAIAEVARQAGLSHVLIKVADGSGPYNIDKKTNLDTVPAVVAALRQQGIQPWGWQYIYGRNADTEARIAIQRVQQFNLDGFVVNAEKEFKEKGMESVARRYMQQLRAGLPNTPIALSSFRYPSMHRPLPFETFLEYCDLNMPQVYWVKAYNPGQQLVKSLREYQSLKIWRPYLPTGAAYGEHGWRATPDQVSQFLQAVKDNDPPGANFWERDYPRQNKSALWNPVKNFPWPTTPQEKPVEITIRFLEALNSNDPVKVTSLYSPSGVHVTAQRTVQGSQAILGWYNTLLRNTLPNARFEVTGTSQTNDLRTITWRAESSSGRVLDGKDSLGVKNEKIAYHYTYFTVQEN